LSKTIALIYGGSSGEHEVSCVSASYIDKNLRAAGYSVVNIFLSKTGQWHLQESVVEKSAENRVNPADLIVSKENPLIRTNDGDIEFDFVFPIIHGPTGEDGALQGLLEFYNIPYAGAGIYCSSLCMDKYFSRETFAKNKIPQVKYERFSKSEWEKKSISEAILSSFEFPVFIKPCCMGSSVGVSLVNQESELKQALELAFKYDNFILCEEGRNVREVEVSILGNYPDYEVSCAGEIISNHTFYSYEAKYLDAHGADLIIPAKLSEKEVETIKLIAKEAFKAVNGDGFARIDFFIDKDSGEILLNEINTLPGFTPISMFPLLWQKSGIEGTSLVNKIVDLGQERNNYKKAISVLK